MAITAPTVTGDFSGFLTKERAEPIFNEAYRASAAQQLARKVPLGLAGTEVPVITSKPTAAWVAEAGQKPASKGGMTLKSMTPKKIAAIAVVSAEVVRANPGGYVDEIRPQLGEAFAIAFDAAVFHGTNTPFGAYLDQATNAVGIGSTAANAGSVHGDLVAALRLLVSSGKKLTGFALDTRLEPDLLGAVDTTGRPLYIESPYEGTAPAARGGRLLGRPSSMADGIGAATPGGTSVTYPLGYAGDWSQVAWGQIGGISYDVSTEATVTINGELTSLWENNLVAVRAETEFGLLINDVSAFVKLTKTTPSS
ncbi:phage major capsid protein [Pseudonocardia sp.]|uniref:phage major capsid protein n=1 Tax=Pseudonocardia sp. TaxID=60912 RepID=UPI003D0E86F1